MLNDYGAKVNRLMEIDMELNRLRAAINGGTDVEANTVRVRAIVAEAETMLGDIQKDLAAGIVPAPGHSGIPTAAPLEYAELSATPSERELLRAALFNSTSAGVLYWSSAAQLWRVDARRGREICVSLGVDPDDRKPVRRAGDKRF